MSDLKKFGKKLFTMSVVAMTIAWSVGLSALVPAGVAAATCPSLSAGDLFKVTGNAAVYLVNPSMQRMYFPHANVYKTWFGSDFSKVKTIDPTCVDAYPNGGGLNYRPGSVLIKSVISPSVYAVGAGGVKMKITSPEVAAALYGSNWAKLIIDQADAFDALYTVGSELATAKPHDGMLVKGTDGVVYSVSGGKLMKVEGTLPANLMSDVRMVTDAVRDTLTKDAATVTPATLVANPSQKAAGTTPPVAVGGALTVSLAANTPAAGYAMASAARVEFTKVTFTAGANDVTVDSFKVKRTGVGVDADFSTINVVDPDGNLLNDSGKTPNSDHEVTFTEDIMVPANSSKTYTLVGDMAAAATMVAGNVPKLALTAVVSNASSVSGLPVEGNAMSTNESMTLGTVTLAQGNAIGTVTKQVGTSNLNLMNLKVTNTGSADTKSVKLGKVVLYNTGTVADSDVSNYVLKYNGNAVAKGVMKNKYLTFDLSACTEDCTIPKGYDRTYEVYGDLTGGSGRSVELYVYAASHVLVMDVNNKIYLTPTNNAANANINDIITISQGKVNVTKTTNVPTGNVPGNATNIELGSWNFKVTGEPIDIRTLNFKITTTGTIKPEGLDSLVLYDKDGKAMIGSVDGVGAVVGAGYATSTDTFTLKEGDNILTLKATIDNTAVANDTIKVDINMASSVNFIGRGVNSSLDITHGTYATPAAVVDGPTKTVKTSALSVATLQTPASATYAPGVNDIVLAKVSLDASNSSEDLKVSQFKIKDVVTTGKSIDVQNIRLFVDKDGDSYNGTGTTVALTEVQNGTDSDAGDDEVLTFNLSGDDQFIVKTGKKLVVEVKGNIVSGATAGTHVFSTNLADYVSATGQTTKNTVTESIDTTVNGPTITVGTAGGQLEVALSSDSATSRLFAAGTTATLASFKFIATTTEDVEVDYMYLTQVVTDTASSSYKDYDEIWFEDAAGVEIAGTRTSPSSTVPYVEFSENAFVVKTSDTSKTLYLKAKLAAIASGSNGVSAHQLGYKVSAAADVVAKGDLTGSASTEWLSSSSAPTGNTHYVYKTYPVFTRKSVESNKLANGTRDLFKFQVSAVNGDIALNGFTFDVATTTAVVTAGSLYLYDVTDTNEKQVNETGGSAPLGVFQTVGYNNDWDTSYTSDEITVSPNLARTFILRGNISGAATGASVSVGMAGDSAGISEAATLMLSATNVDSQVHDDFIWSDKNNNSHSVSTADWTNGYLVSGLSSSTSTLETVAY